MNLTLADYIKLKNMEPGSEEAVHMGCTCTREVGKHSGKASYTVDPFCPFHWHFANQAFIKKIMSNLKKEELFNNAMRVGYLVLGIGLAAIVLYKF